MLVMEYLETQMKAGLIGNNSVPVDRLGIVGDTPQQSPGVVQKLGCSYLKLLQVSDCRIHDKSQK